MYTLHPKCQGTDILCIYNSITCTYVLRIQTAVLAVLFMSFTSSTWHIRLQAIQKYIKNRSRASRLGNMRGWASRRFCCGDSRQHTSRAPFPGRFACKAAGFQWFSANSKADLRPERKICLPSPTHTWPRAKMSIINHKLKTARRVHSRGRPSFDIKICCTKVP